ncbi:CD59B glycoprotein-like [Clupea harengus]|uniref:CD59B glycoprotein-like n=1 Tax=Clupea harengus TaxID=7950 RepID=A0A6P8EZ06_CLUHA|nr:CD59B glycoprotein-like [Clupea harengus]
MHSLSLGLTVLLAVFCATQALKCHHCVNINKENPDCTNIEERECSPMLTHCLTVRMHHPAYGEVRKCATQKECDGKAPAFVERHCCEEDLCN